MDIRIQCLFVDTVDPRAIATFWKAALGWRRTGDEDEAVCIEPPVGSPEDGVAPDILLLRVPEGNQTVSRSGVSSADALTSVGGRVQKSSPPPMWLLPRARALCTQRPLSASQSLKPINVVCAAGDGGAHSLRCRTAFPLNEGDDADSASLPTAKDFLLDHITNPGADGLTVLGG